MTSKDTSTSSPRSVFQITPVLVNTSIGPITTEDSP